MMLPALKYTAGLKDEVCALNGEADKVEVRVKAKLLFRLSLTLLGSSIVGGGVCRPA